MESKAVFFQLLCQFSCNLLDRLDSIKASAELSVESTICLLFGYVKQTVSPYSSMMSSFTALFDTIPAEPSFNLSLMEVRLCVFGPGSLRANKKDHLQLLQRTIIIYLVLVSQMTVHLLFYSLFYYLFLLFPNSYY